MLDVISKLVDMGANAPQELDGVVENVSFSLPKELRVKCLVTHCLPMARTVCFLG